MSNDMQERPTEGGVQRTRATPVPRDHYPPPSRGGGAPQGTFFVQGWWLMLDPLSFSKSLASAQRLVGNFRASVVFSASNMGWMSATRRPTLIESSIFFSAAEPEESANPLAFFFHPKRSRMLRGSARMARAETPPSEPLAEASNHMTLVNECVQALSCGHAV